MGAGPGWKAALGTRCPKQGLRNERGNLEKARVRAETEKRDRWLLAESAAVQKRCMIDLST